MTDGRRRWIIISFEVYLPYHHFYLEGMGFGNKVRIVRPPPGFKAWTDKKAEVITLLPIAKHPLLYEVRDEDGKSLTLPADALEPCKIDREEERGGAFGGYLIVNDLMYCLEHELEVCGKCGVDHRATNFMHECTRDNEVERMEAWLENMKRIGAPSRQAPKKKGKVDIPGNPAVFRPAISNHLLLLSRHNISFDLSGNNQWPRGWETEERMRHHVLSDTDVPMPELAKLPVRRVRETLVVLARRWDNYLPQKSENEPMCRMLLQDEAQTQVLLLDLVLPIRMMIVGGFAVPAFVVRWMHCSATDGQHALQAMLESTKRNTKMGEVPVKVDEIQVFVEFLKENSKILERMNPSYVQKEERKHLSVSVLTSISSDMQVSHYASIGKYCHQCGTSNCDKILCSRCLKARYCSRTCQKVNWKFHKKECCK